VQTEPLNRLVAPFLGLFWQEIRERYPKVEIQGALEPVVELFGLPRAVPATGFRVMDKPETPRCWFITEDDTELVQLQQDRLIHNWRKRRSDDVYPRYPKLRQTFAKELGLFVDFIKREGLGSFVPNQCEVTYINHLVYRTSTDHGRIDQLFRTWTGAPEAGFLPRAENVQFDLSYVMTAMGQTEPIGRLHVASRPALLKKDNTSIVSFNLTARGRPQSSDIEGVLRLLDVGREWIVRAFDELTTTSMHEMWGKV
jgi:uncharacterized protein (TIGR04255 family)